MDAEGEACRKPWSCVLIQVESAFDAVWPVLAEAVWNPDESRYQALKAQYLASHHQLWAFSHDSVIVGVAGVARDHDTAAITHIAVARPCQRQGYGRQIFEALRDTQPNVRQWIAETDDDAVEFYRRLGFEILAAPRQYVHTRRYQCVYRC